MKNRSYVGLAIKVALFYFTLTGLSQSLRAQTELRFRLAHNTLVVVPVMAGTEGPFDFVLDTGADTSVVDPSITRQLLMASAGSTEQTTLAGKQTLTTGTDTYSLDWFRTSNRRFGAGAGPLGTSSDGLSYRRYRGRELPVGV